MKNKNNPQNDAYTRCTVCNGLLKIDEAYKCNICKNHVHPGCFDDAAGMCKDCSKKMDKE